MRMSGLALVFALVVILPACGGKTPSAPTPVTVVTTTTTTSVPPTTTVPTTTTTTTTAPAGVSQFDGAYRGTFRGTFSGVPVSGPVEFRTSNGAVTVTQPADGTGRVDATGLTSFGGVVTGLGTNCTFTGSVAVTNGTARASGAWACGSSGSGTWEATR